MRLFIEDCKTVKMIEAFIGRHQEMYFNMNSVLESLEAVELNTEKTKVEQWMNVKSESTTRSSKMKRKEGAKLLLATFYYLERALSKLNEPVIYYLYDRDQSKRGFVHEEILVVSSHTQLPPANAVL